MYISIRTDASLEIGAGHVMRCLTLANQLRALGAKCDFITRALPGHMIERIRNQNFNVHTLPVYNETIIQEETAPRHFHWAQAPTVVDAHQTRAVLSDKTEWLILDHYAFGSQWENKVIKGRDTRLFVIDDLADRPHQADVLLDQNLGRKKSDYIGLLPVTTDIFVGPQYALLRPEFAIRRRTGLVERKARMGRLQTILITMGGFDSNNATGCVLDALRGFSHNKAFEVKVVLGDQSPHLRSVKAQLSSLPYACEILTDVNNMADLMVWADLAIGAVGSTTWERCALGLPTLMVVIAHNQEPAAKAMDKLGAGISLGWPSNAKVFTSNLKAALMELSSPQTLNCLSEKSAKVCQGDGAPYIAEKIIKQKIDIA